MTTNNNRLETYDDFFAFGQTKGWSEDFCHKFAEQKVQERTEAKRIYAVGTQEQLEALFVKERKTPEQARAKALDVLSKRKTVVADTQHNLFTNGTFSQLVAYAKQNGKENPEKFANGILKRAWGEVLDHGTPEQVADIGRKYYEVSSENIQRFVDARLARRGTGGGGSTAVASTTASVVPATTTAKTKNDQFERLVWFAKSGKLKEGVLDDIAAAKFARAKIQKDNREILETGSPEQVLAVARAMHLDGDTATKYVDTVLSKRTVKV